MSKLNELRKYSNPEVVMMKARDMGLNTIQVSTRKDKKYMVYNSNKKLVHFGQMGYEDFLKHKNLVRKNSYLTRSANMKGNWKQDGYSANNLSRNILW